MMFGLGSYTGDRLVEVLQTVALLAVMLALLYVIIRIEREIRQATDAVRRVLETRSAIDRRFDDVERRLGLRNDTALNTLRKVSEALSAAFRENGTDGH